MSQSNSNILLTLVFDDTNGFLESDHNVVEVVPPMPDGSNPVEVEFYPDVEAILAHPTVRLLIVCRDVCTVSRFVLEIFRVFANFFTYGAGDEGGEARNLHLVCVLVALSSVYISCRHLKVMSPFEKCPKSEHW